MKAQTAVTNLRKEETLYRKKGDYLSAVESKGVPKGGPHSQHSGDFIKKIGKIEIRWWVLKRRNYQSDF